jgi:hypothetical protein
MVENPLEIGTPRKPTNPRILSFGNLAHGVAGCDSDSAMAHYPQCNPLHRATRLQLATTSAQVKSGNGNCSNARLHIVSITGGLLQLTRALAEGDFVELAFPTKSGDIHGMAEMLNPVPSAPGSVFQPFRFVALGDDDHRILNTLIESARDSSFRGLRSGNWVLRNI